jgi:hypothetical protein
MRDAIVRRIKRHRPSPAMLVALIALFVALGGTSYAALKLPANSVGSAQVINGSLQTGDLAKKTAAALKGKPGQQGSQGTPGATGATGATGAAGATGPAGKDGSNATIDGVVAGGDLAGAFPNPTTANGAVGAAAIAPTLFDGSAVTPTLRSIGSGSQQAAAGNDPRLSDQRTPLDNSVTGAKVANGTLRIADLFPIKQTATINVPSIPASSCTGFSIASAGTSPGDIAFGFAPLDLSDELVLPPSMFDTAGETPLKICNIGATALDPPSMTYTVYTITG